VSYFIYGRQGKLCAETNRQKHTRTNTHIHPHTWLAGVQHIGHILVVSIILEAQLLSDTHTSAHKAKTNVTACWLTISMSKVG
jgi:hypothetical protein